MAHQRVNYPKLPDGSLSRLAKLASWDEGVVEIKQSDRLGVSIWEESWQVRLQSLLVGRQLRFVALVEP